MSAIPFSSEAFFLDRLRRCSLTEIKDRKSSADTALPKPVFVVVANSFSCEMKASMFADRRLPLMALAD